MEDSFNIAFVTGSYFTIDLLEKIKESQGNTLNEVNNTDIDINIFNIPINLKLVITNFDDIVRGRVRENPVSNWCKKNNIKVLKGNVNDYTNDLKSEIDIVIVASYGKILKANVLNAARFGCINWHPSKLPKYRGPSPVQQCILDGCENTALTWIAMDSGMDSGDIILQEEILVESGSFSSLIKKAVNAGVNTIFTAISKKVLSDLKIIALERQDESKATYTKFITKEMGLIDPLNETYKTFIRKFRAFNEFPKIKVYLPEFEGFVRIDEVGDFLEDHNHTFKKNLAIIDNLTYLKLKDGLMHIKKITLQNGKQKIL